MSFIERSGFRSDLINEVYFFFGLDRPIYKEQIDRLVASLDKHHDKIMVEPRSKDAQLLKKWWKHFDSVAHDGYGSFRLEFHKDIWDLDDNTLSACNEQLYEMLQESNFINEMLHWVRIEEDLEDHIETDGAVETMKYYIDALIGCGYCVDQKDVEEMFEGCIDSNIIANEFLMRSLAGQNVSLKKVETEDNNWPFEMA